MAISVVMTGFYGACHFSRGTGLVSAPLARGDVFIELRADASHTFGFWLDGILVEEYGQSNRINAGEAPRFGFAIPNDGIDHKITIIDDGTRGTPATKLEVSLPAVDCAGVIMFEYLGDATHPTSKEKYVKVRAVHSGAIDEPFGAQIYIRTSPFPDPLVWLKPGEETVLVHRVPADYKLHVVEGRMRRTLPDGSAHTETALLHRVVKGNPKPPPAQDPSASVTLFAPGETVFVHSAPSSTPMATDGSEWVLLEIRQRPQSGQPAQPWQLVGAEGGYVLPAQDGTWASSIQTDAIAFPRGSKWDLRARRFREARESVETVQYFDMGNAGVPQPTLAAPTILGPTGPGDGLLRLGTWATMFGSGTPGSVVEFQATTTDTDYTPNPPQRCTVGVDGKWTTRFIEHLSGVHEDRVIQYRARATLNGLTTDWSGSVALWWSDQ
jgi:hypothetical protein